MFFRGNWIVITFEDLVDAIHPMGGQALRTISPCFPTGFFANFVTLQDSISHLRHLP